MNYVGRIIVGWKPQLREGTEAIMPEFLPNKGTNDPEKQARQIEERQAKFAAEALFLPYYSSVACAVLTDPLFQRQETFPKAKSKQPVSVQIAEWLLLVQDYERKSSDGTCPFEFIGFKPREFVKMWGMGCAEAGNPIPDCVWIGSSNYKDIENVALGDVAKVGGTIDIPLRRFGLVDHYKLALPYQPFQNPEQDMLVTFELASRLGMLSLVTELAENMD